VKNQLFCYFQT